MNDRIRLTTETCPCGLPFAVVESVQGRVEDTLRLPGVAGGRIAVPPLVFNPVMGILPVSGWQVAQEADDGLTVRVSGVRDGLADRVLVDQLTQALSAQGARVPYVTVQRVTAIPKTAAGKAPLIRARC